MLFNKSGNRTCGICGAKLSRGARYCDNCGAKVPDAPPGTGSPGPYAPSSSNPRRSRGAAAAVVIAVTAVFIIAIGILVMSFMTISQKVPSPQGIPSGQSPITHTDPKEDAQDDTDDGFWGDIPPIPAGGDSEQFVEMMRFISERILSEDMSVSSVTVDFDEDEGRLSVTVRTGDSISLDDEAFEENLRSVKEFIRTTTNAYGIGSISVVIVIEDENGKELYRMENTM